MEGHGRRKHDVGDDAARPHAIPGTGDIARPPQAARPAAPDRLVDQPDLLARVRLRALPLLERAQDHHQLSLPGR